MNILLKNNSPPPLALLGKLYTSAQTTKNYHPLTRKKNSKNREYYSIFSLKQIIFAISSEVFIISNPCIINLILAIILGFYIIQYSTFGNLS